MIRLPKANDEKTLSRFLNLLGIASTVVAVGAFYALLFQPMANFHEAQMGRIEQLEALSKSTAAVKSEHRRLRDQLHKTQTMLESIRSRIPAQPQGGQFVRDVRQAADRMQVTVTNHNISESRRHPEHSETRVSFRCHGGYASICRLLEEVSHFPRITKVAEFELEEGQNFAVYPFRVTFVLYHGLQSNDIKKKRSLL